MVYILKSVETNINLSPKCKWQLSVIQGANPRIEIAAHGKRRKRPSTSGTAGSGSARGTKSGWRCLIERIMPMFFGAGRPPSLTAKHLGDCTLRTCPQDARVSTGIIFFFPFITPVASISGYGVWYGFDGLKCGRNSKEGMGVSYDVDSYKNH